MSCKEIQDLMSAFLDNQLTLEEHAKLIQHTSTCKTCKEDFQLYQIMQSTLQETPIQPLPENFHQDLMGRIEKEVAKKKVISFKFSTLNKVAAILVLVMIGFVGFKYFRPIEEKSMRYQEADSYSEESVQEETAVATLEAKMAPVKENKTTKAVIVMPIEEANEAPETLASAPVPVLEEEVTDQKSADEITLLDDEVEQMPSPQVTFEENAVSKIEADETDISEEMQEKPYKRNAGVPYIIGMTFLTLLIVLGIKIRDRWHK